MLMTVVTSAKSFFMPSRSPQIAPHQVPKARKTHSAMCLPWGELMVFVLLGLMLLE